MSFERKSVIAVDPATGRPLPAGVQFRGPRQYRARKLLHDARVTRTFESARAAREWLEEQAVEVRRGTYVDRSHLERVKLRELIERFRDEVLVIGGDCRGAREDRGHLPSMLADPIADLTLANVSPAVIAGFKKRQIAAGRADLTVAKRLNMLQRIFNAAREWGFNLGQNPASDRAVPRPRHADVRRNRRLGVLPRDPQDSEAGDAKSEEEVLLDALKKTRYPDDYYVTKMAIEQGMRQGEILAMRWEDVDFAKKVITVRGRHEKGTKSGARHEAASKAQIGWEKRPLMPAAAALLLIRLRHAPYGGCAGNFSTAL